MLVIVLNYPLDHTSFVLGSLLFNMLRKVLKKWQKHSVAELMTKLSWVVKRKLDNQKLEELLWGEQVTK